MLDMNNRQSKPNAKHVLHWLSCAFNWCSVQGGLITACMIHLCKPLTTLTTNLVRAKVTKEEDLDDNQHYGVMIIHDHPQLCVSIIISMTAVMLMLPRYAINCGNETLVYSYSQDGGDSDGHGDRGSYCSWRQWCWKLLWLQERPRQKDVCASQPVWKVSISKNTISKIGRIQECLAQFKLLDNKSKLPHGIIFSVITLLLCELMNWWITWIMETRPLRWPDQWKCKVVECPWRKKGCWNEL